MARSPMRTLLGLLFLASLAAAYYEGDGTAYSGDDEVNATGFNACEFSDSDLSSHWKKWYAAMPTGCGDRGWDASKCGWCVRVRGTESGASGGWITVKLVDQCASCSCGDVDLSSRGLNAATGFSWDRKRIEWEWDPDCSGGSSSRSNDSEDSSPSPSPDANNDSNCEDGYKWSKRKHKCYKKKDRRLMTEEA